MRGLIDDARIYVKLLLMPALATLALAVVAAAVVQDQTVRATLERQVLVPGERRLQSANDAKVQAAGLQASMFRFVALSLLGESRLRLTELEAEIGRRDRALEKLLDRVADDIDDPHRRALLRAAWSNYRRQSPQMMAVVLGGDVHWGPATARNAGVALDGLIDQADAQHRAAEQTLLDAKSVAATLGRTQRLRTFLALGIGSPVMIALSLFLAGCIAGPVRRLTAAMSRLAAGDYDTDIPAVFQRDEVGSMARAVEVFRDGLRRLDTLAREQRAMQAFLDTVLENVPACIVVTDAETLRCLHVNRAAEHFLGIGRQHLVGHDSRDVLPPPLNVAALRRAGDAASAPGLPTVDEAVLIETHRNGQRLATITRLAIAGVDVRARYLLTMLEDVTERRRAEQRIAYMAHHDALTDLPNRTLFAERLAEAVAAVPPGGAPVAVLGLDLDRFKEVNDTLGHAAGDALLRAVTARLAACLRGGDTFARLGGDEFAIIQCHVRVPADAEALAARLIECAGEPFVIDGQQVLIGLSVGIAFSTPGMEPSELVKQADIALYEAKQSGRGCCRCFVHDMNARLLQRRQLEVDLRAAIGTGQLLLQYQPQIDLESGAILGAEALMRWNRPGHGQVAPSTFIPLAEDIGLIGTLGTWLLATACQEAAGWPEPMRVAVNVSPVQLRLPGFLGSVRAALAQSGLDPHRLELEVTEGILLQDSDEALGIFNALHVLGVRLALDDFGTGYASLGYLQKFRFNKIKIDRSFVRGLNSDPNASAIVRAVVGLSDLLGIRTSAEGVETEEEVTLLRTYGCKEAQGFHFWRPMEAPAMARLAAGRRAAEAEPVAL